MSMMSEHITEILSFVLDNLQVVSYKWLSRKLSISSNQAKRLLQKFVEQHNTDVDVIYVVSGWSKTVPRCYSVQLVPKSKLQECMDMLEGHVSSHVYSVQPCIPKDSAEIWSAEYIQSEELFKQPPELSNSLRDNRFSAVTCEIITRNVSGARSSNAGAAPPKVSTPSTSSLAKPSLVQAEVALGSTPGFQIASKPSAAEASAKDSRDASAAVVSKGNNTVNAKKRTAGSGEGALANLWGRVSSKPKASSSEAREKMTIQDKKLLSGAAEAHVNSHITSLDASSDDDDATNFAHIRRGQPPISGTHKRRVVFEDELSDVEDDDKNIISLASPEVPKERYDNTSIQKDQAGKILSEIAQKAKTSSRGQVQVADTLPTELPMASNGASPREKADNLADHIVVETPKPSADWFPKTEDGNKSKQVTEKCASLNAAPIPKKRKVIKTHIDERGREVSEVVWENDDAAVSMKEDNKSNRDAEAHAHVEALKSLNARSLSSGTAKGANVPSNPPSKMNTKLSGKTASKDSQKGKILSFFKKT